MNMPFRKGISIYITKCTLFSCHYNTINADSLAYNIILQGMVFKADFRNICRIYLFNFETLTDIICRTAFWSFDYALLGLSWVWKNSIRTLLKGTHGDSGLVDVRLDLNEDIAVDYRIQIATHSYAQTYRWVWGANIGCIFENSGTQIRVVLLWREVQ